MADDVKKDDRPTAQVYRLSTFATADRTRCARTSAPTAAKRPMTRSNPTPSSPKTSTSSSTSARRATRASSSRPTICASSIALSQENNALGPCIEAMVTNGDGTGYDFEAIDAETEDEEDDENIEELKEFFDEPWPGTSFGDIRKLCRATPSARATPTSRCSATRRTKWSMFRRVDAKMMRMLRLDDAIPVPITVTRKGKDRPSPS